MGVSAGVAGVASAAAGIYGSMSAASSQKKALENAQGTLAQYYGDAQQNLAPYMTGGATAFNNLLNMTGNQSGGNGTGALTTAFQPTQAQLEQTPGYQFTLNQGLKAAQNSNAAKGLGTSGEALAGATNYATGLAGTTYQQQFANYLTQNQQIYNMLSGVAGTGATAANTLSSLGLSTASQIAGLQTGVGNAEASGTLGATNALSSGVNSAASGYTTNQLLSLLYGSGASTTPTATNVPTSLTYQNGQPLSSY